MGEEARVGSGNFEADSQGFVLDFLRGGMSCFSCSSDDGSSSSTMPGTFGVLIFNVGLTSMPLLLIPPYLSLAFALRVAASRGRF